jgi:hypothetical protein
MFCITRGIVRWGLITGLALGGATLLVGPERVAAALAHIRTKAQSVVDGAMDNPTALRRQVQQLADQYPGRIAEIEREIGEVDYQIDEFTEDTEVARRVVELASADLDELKELIARADAVEPGRPVFVRFEGFRFDVNQAKGEYARISKVRAGYQDRVAGNQQQLEMLQIQKARLGEVHGKLTDEYSSFETKMWQLDRQIDAIERNDRLIEMTEQLQATLASYDKWGEVGNLKQIESKLRELRRIQEAQMQRLQASGIQIDYEKAARHDLELSREQQDDGEETSETLDEFFGAHDQDPVAWREPVVVEN